MRWLACQWTHSTSGCVGTHGALCYCVPHPLHVNMQHWTPSHVHSVHMWYCSVLFSVVHVLHVQHHTVLHVTCVQTADTLHTIRCTKLSPHPVCWDLLPSPAIAAQSHDNHSHWPYGEQSSGPVRNITLGSHQYWHTHVCIQHIQHMMQYMMKTSCSAIQHTTPLTLSTACMLAPWCSSNLTTAVWPSWQAKWRAVLSHCGCEGDRSFAYCWCMCNCWPSEEINYHHFVGMYHK